MKVLFHVCVYQGKNVNTWLPSVIVTGVPSWRVTVTEEGVSTGARMTVRLASWFLAAIPSSMLQRLLLLAAGTAQSAPKKAMKPMQQVSKTSRTLRRTPHARAQMHMDLRRISHTPLLYAPKPRREFRYIAAMNLVQLLNQAGQGVLVHMERVRTLAPWGYQSVVEVVRLWPIHRRRI